MNMKQLINKADYHPKYFCQNPALSSGVQASFRQTKRLEAMKQFRADSAKLRAEISRKRAERASSC